MTNQITAVHVTHEAVGKVGGIGAVLEGFFTCKLYLTSQIISIRRIDHDGKRITRFVYC